MKKTYFQNLDALRFFAFFSVFLFHGFYTTLDSVKENKIYQLCYWLTRGGELGVNFFFVLSGFLITYLLLEEEKRAKRISVRNFYIRRVLRIWPLYFLITAFCFFVYPFIRHYLGASRPETANPLLYLFFLSNYDNIYNASSTPTLFTLWSISIEEQFYLCWPLLMLIFPLQRKWVPMVLVIIVNIAARLYLLYSTKDHLHFNTFCVTSDMAMGGLFAWIFFCKKDWLKPLENLNKGLIAIAYVLGIILCITWVNWSSFAFLKLFERIILGSFFVFIIFDQIYLRNSVLKVGNIKPFTWLGTLTYGLYCYHVLCMIAGQKINSIFGLNKSVFGVLIIDNLVSMALSVAVAYLSFRFFESYFLKLKSRFQLQKRTSQIEKVPAP